MKKREFLNLQLDVTELDPGQKRLLRYMNSVLLAALSSDDENEYFESSNEAMKMFGTLIRQANFTQLPSTKASSVPYDKQALEFCIDSLTEDVLNKKPMVFEN